MDRPLPPPPPFKVVICNLQQQSYCPLIVEVPFVRKFMVAIILMCLVYVETHCELKTVQPYYIMQTESPKYIGTHERRAVLSWPNALDLI